MKIARVIGRIAPLAGIAVAALLARYAFSVAMDRLLPPSLEIIGEAAPSARGS